MDQTTNDVLSDNHFLDLWNQTLVSSGEEVGKEIRKLLTRAYTNKSEIRRGLLFMEKTEPFTAPGRQMLRKKM